MNFLRKLFHIPTPFELGKSDKFNALPSSYFPSGLDQNEYTWEKYEIEMKQKYPIKWFIVKTIPFWFDVNLVSKFKHFKYWLVSHLIPSRRYHFLDLRQPEKDEYKWGWIDSDQQMLYACFNILRNYVEKELEKNFPKFSEDEDPTGKWSSHYREVEKLYEFWTVERPWKQKQIENFAECWADFKKMGDQKTAEKYLDKCMEAKENLAALEQENLIALIKIRNGMWT